MKTTSFLVILTVLLFASCEKNERDLLLDSSEGFSIKTADSTVLDHTQIEFYDFSSHLIYLKNNNSFFNNTNKDNFSVFADNVEIYSGQIYHMYSSYLPIGPVIRCAPSFYGDYIIPIGFNQIIDSLGNTNVDPREDIRIIKTLKKYNQYQEGLDCKIVSVQNISSNKVKVELRLTNNDSFNLYYLDPDKMGINLYHYFTTGLFLRDLSNETFTHNISTTQPEPWNTWEFDWLSIINSKESKIISIVYDNFEPITSGQFEAIFNFPGLSSQVEQKDLQQNNGRIWLGDLQMAKKIVIE